MKKIGVGIAVVLVLAGTVVLVREAVKTWPLFTVPKVDLTVATTALNQIKQQQLQKQTQRMQQIIDDFAKKYPGQTSIVVTDLTNGITVTHDADKPTISASLYKIFVAWEVYRRIDAGEMNFKTTVKAVGQSVEHCLDVMITVSDNDCAKALGDMVDWAQLDARLAGMGYTQTKTNNYHKSGALNGDKFTTASETARFLQALYEGKLLSQKSTDHYIALLKADELNTWLPSGLPKGTVIAHKTGALYNLVHDAGVVYTSQGNYLVVMMTRDWDNPSAQSPKAFADLSRQLWLFFTS